MKDKIKVALKTRYTNLGFGEKAFEGVADYLTIAIKEESEIDNIVNGVENLLKAFQSEIDGRVNTAVEKAKKEKQEGGQTQQTATQTNQTDDTPAWAKSLIEANQNLTAKIAAIEGSHVSKTRQQTLSEKLKDAPKPFSDKILKDFQRMQFASDEDFQTYLTETENDINSAVQEFANNGLTGVSKPFVSGATANSSIEAAIKKHGELTAAQNQS